jgi:hypothetical protein
MKSNKIESNKPIIALYDSNEKKLIGIFSTSTLAAKYIFKDEHTTRQTSRTITAWCQKNKIHHNDMSYAVRTANEEQKQLLGTNEFIVINGYKQPSNHNMRSYNNNRVNLNIVGKEKTQKYWNEQKNKKVIKIN